MSPATPRLHDAYAAEYDKQAQACDCHIAGILFGLCYEFVQPRQRILDLGIGSGLSAALFAKAGLEVYGMDFSPAMLEVCQRKGIAVCTLAPQPVRLTSPKLPPRRGSFSFPKAIMRASKKIGATP